jgi:clan AA aspartic protease (TIGR02281 family)
MMSERLKPCFRVVSTTLALALLLAAASFSSAFAGPLEDDARAYKRGDFAAAMRLLRPLAERGNAPAQQYLGLMYEFGEGVPQNDAEAMKWTLMAAKQGNSSAQSHMSSFYRFGWGVPQNYILAYMWESVSGRNLGRGQPIAKMKSQEELEPHMAPSQIAEAEDLAQQCIESRYENCPATRQRVAALPSSPKLSQPSSNSSQVTVPLKVSGSGTFSVPVEINGKMTLDFTLDSGASDVTLPSDVFTTLKRTGTLKETDIVGQRTFVLADGSKTQSDTFTIRSLKVGDIIIENVAASVAPSQGPLLLGQSFLQRFKSWSIDNATGGLLLETR